jgi:hypothetical protein
MFFRVFVRLGFVSLGVSGKIGFFADPLKSSTRLCAALVCDRLFIAWTYRVIPYSGATFKRPVSTGIPSAGLS